MEFLLWIVSIIVAISVWELYHLGLDWWGFIEWREWLKWGREGKPAGVYKWSYRLGPLQIYRM